MPEEESSSMTTHPDPKDVPQGRSKQLRLLAGLTATATATAAAAAAVATRRFTQAWREAEQQDVAETLFDHPDLVEADMDAARWWDTP